MKKFILSGMLALGLTAASGQEAKAWVNFKFGVGMNMSLQSTEITSSQGAFPQRPTPRPRSLRHPGGHPGYGGGHPGFVPGPGPGHGHGQDFPFYGSATQPRRQQPLPCPPPLLLPPSPPRKQTYWQGGSNPYHTVGYSPSYSYTPNYYYPSTYGYYYAAPNYWYGR